VSRYSLQPANPFHDLTRLMAGAQAARFFKRLINALEYIEYDMAAYSLVSAETSHSVALAGSAHGILGTFADP
jgi:hypothetical protein